MTDEDIRAVAPFVLAHRRRRSPLEPPGIEQSALDDAFDDAFGAGAENDSPPPELNGADPDADPDRDPEEGDDPDTEAGDAPSCSRSSVADPGPALVPPTLLARPSPNSNAGRRAPAPSDRGRFVRAEPSTGSTDIAATATAIALAERRAGDPLAEVSAADLRSAVRAARTGNLVVLCVDASGSMGAAQRMSLAKGAVLGLLTDAYQRRDRIALVTFAGDTADVVLRPTASVEIAQARLRELPTGGASPIAEGLDAVLRLLAGSTGDSGLSPLVVLVTDGRATGVPDALDRSRASARRLAELCVPVVVVDAESGPTRLGLAAELAEVMNAPCLALDALADGSLERTIRLHLR